MSEYGKRELIVIAKAEFGVRATAEGAASFLDADVSSLTNFLTTEGVTLKPLFGVSEDRLQKEATSFKAATGTEMPDLSVYYTVEAPDERLDELAERLRELEVVEAAYVKPPAEPPSETPEIVRMLNDMVPLAEEAPLATPDFSNRQGYLNAAPEGVEARYAWMLPGGRGTGVNIIDIEWGWNFNNEDLRQNQGGVVSGTNSSDDNHGTAVLGEFSGDRNKFGITGIAPDARVSAVSLTTHATAAAIRIAADRLRPGDIILLEVHRAGPRHNFRRVSANRDATTPGYIAIEWWPDDFSAIRYAVSRGIVVVEAAGNGAENLDDAIYNTRPAGFPVSWRNPFNTSNPSSDAVLVGAGNPPPGTHGRNSNPLNAPVPGEPYADRARCAFSNYGSRVDAQGWGWEVTSTGYGDLQGGTNKDLWYTDTFCGTSSASPIVVGSLSSVQGILRAQQKPLMTPAKARHCLRATGSPQKDGPGWTEAVWGAHPARPRTQRIGNRPNIKQLIPCAGGELPEVEKDVVYQYAVKFVCGKAHGDVLAPGEYWTAINVHNPTSNTIKFRKKIAVTLPNERAGPVTEFFDAKLGPDEALEIDREDIFKHARQRVEFLKGFVVIESYVELDVVAVYTATGSHKQVDVMSIERVIPRKQMMGKPDLIPVPDENGNFCKTRDGMLVVTVKNQGTLGAGPSKTKVDFGKYGTVTQQTPSLAPGKSVDLSFQIPKGCFDPDCEFKITVDADDDVVESDEGNNTARGICRG